MVCVTLLILSTFFMHHDPNAARWPVWRCSIKSRRVRAKPLSVPTSAGPYLSAVSKDICKTSRKQRKARSKEATVSTNKICNSETEWSHTPRRCHDSSPVPSSWLQTRLNYPWLNCGCDEQTELHKTARSAELLASRLSHSKHAQIVWSWDKFDVWRCERQTTNELATYKNSYIIAQKDKQQQKRRRFHRIYSSRGMQYGIIIRLSDRTIWVLEWTNKSKEKVSFLWRSCYYQT